MLFALLTGLLTYPQIAQLSDGLPGDSGRPADDALLNCWILAWTPHALTTGRPVFDTNIFHPRKNTLAYSEHMFGNLPFAGPIYLASRNPILAHNVVLLLTFVLSGLGMFLLTFEIVGRGYPAIAAGIVFAFSSFRFGEYAHVQVLSAQWMPFCMLFIVRGLRRPSLGRWLAALVFGFAQGLCCSYYAIFFLTYLVLFAVVVWACDRSRRAARAAGLVLGLVIAVGAALYPFYAPYLELRNNMGFKRPIAENVRYSADVLSYLTPRGGSLLYASLRAYLPDVGPSHLFVGLGALVLGAVGVCRVRRHGDLGGALLALAVAGGAAFLFSLGPYVKVAGKSLCPGPYWLLYSFAPGYDGLRAPSRFAMLGMLSLAPIVGVGFDAVWARLRSERARRAMGFGLCAFLVLESVEAPIGLARFRYPDDIPPVHRWLRSQPADTVILELPLDLHYADNLYAFYSTYHWQRLVNGRSGFQPAENVAKFLMFVRFPTPSAVRMARTIGVRYAIVHEEAIPLPLSQMLRSREVRRVQSFGKDHVLEILPGPHEPPRDERPMHVIPWQGCKAVAKPNAGDVKFAFDGRADTFWLTKGGQRKGNFFAIDLGRPRNVGMVRVGFGRRAFALPRYFYVTTSPDAPAVTGKRTRNEFFESVYRSALRSPKDVWGEIRFPTLRCRTLSIVLFQDKPSFDWAMAEIEVHEVEDASR